MERDTRSDVVSDSISSAMFKPFALFESNFIVVISGVQNLGSMDLRSKGVFNLRSNFGYFLRLMFLSFSITKL